MTCYKSMQPSHLLQMRTLSRAWQLYHLFQDFLMDPSFQRWILPQNRNSHSWNFMRSRWWRFSISVNINWVQIFIKEICFSIRWRDRVSVVFVSLNNQWKFSRFCFSAIKAPQRFGFFSNWISKAIEVVRVLFVRFKIVVMVLVFTFQSSSTGRALFSTQCFYFRVNPGGVCLSLTLFWGRNSFTAAQKRSPPLTTFMFMSSSSIAICQGM